MKQLTKFIRFKKEGFTIVEMIVAVAIFLTIIAVVFGIFIRSVRTQRFVNDIMSMNSNASLSLEQIMRELRSGFNFETTNTYSGSVCESAGLYDTLSFTRVRGTDTTDVIYTWDSEAGTIERTEGILPTSVLTAADVDVRQLCFFMLHNKVNDPWRISLFLKVGPRFNSDPENEVNIQTTVSARILPSELFP